MSISGDDERVAGLLDDLESQATAEFARERAAEVADRSRAEYRSITLVSRLVASVGGRVHLRIAGDCQISGVLTGAGHDWCQVDAGRTHWLVNASAIVEVAGASPRSVVEQGWPVSARLGFAARLRRVTSDGEHALIHLTDGVVRPGQVARVGADFIELTDGALIAVARIGSVQVASES